jgi:hypothetical protein
MSKLMIMQQCGGTTVSFARRRRHLQQQNGVPPMEIVI